MPGIGLVVNPNSRRNRRNPGLVHHLEQVLGTQGILATTHSESDIYRVARDFQDRGIDLVCLNGGDGTNHCTISVFIEVYGSAPLPRFAFLRGGTMNTTAWDIGLRLGSPPVLLKKILSCYRDGRPLIEAERNVMKIGGTYGFLFGNGLISNYLEAYYEGGNPSMWKAVTTLTRGICSGFIQGPFIRRLFRKAEAEVRVDGTAWPLHTWDALAAGTIGHIGLGFYPFFKAVRNPGTIHVLGVGCGPMRTIRQLPNIFLSRPTADPELLDAVCRRIELRSSQPFSYTVDGDIHRSQGELELEIGPRLTIVRG